MFTNNFKLDGIDSILEDIGYMDEMKGAGEDQEHKYTKKSGKKSKDYDGDGTVEDETDEYAGVKDRAIKKAMRKEEKESEKEDKEKESEKEDKESEKEDKEDKKEKKYKKESVDFSSVLDELTDEEIIFLSDTLIEEVVEEFFYETLEEGFEIDELETILLEQVESELTYLEEAKVTLGHDTKQDAGSAARERLNKKPEEASRTSKLAKVKDAVKKVASGAKAVAKKVAHGAGEVAGSAVAGYKKASAAAKDAPGGAEKDDSKSDSPSTGSRTPRSSGSSSSASSSGATGTKRPGLLGKIASGLKSGLKKAIHGAGKAVGKVVKTAKAGYDEGRGKSAPSASTSSTKPEPKAAAKPAAKKPAPKVASPAAKQATAKKKSKGNLDNLLNQIRNEQVEQLDEVSPPGFKGTVKAMKKHGEIDNPYALAWYMKNKGYKSHRKASGAPKNEEYEIVEAKQGPCWKGYEMIGMKKKGGREVPNCVPKEEYEELVLDMIEEGYDMEQVRQVIAAYEDGFEVIFEEDGVIINETQEILDEETQFLSDVEMVADWLHAEGIIENEDQFFELMEDLSEEEIEELYAVVMEATAMAKRGYDEAPIRNKIADNTKGGKSADRAKALADKETFGRGDKKARQHLARTQMGDHRKTTSSNPGLHGYGHQSNDPKVKAKQAARGAQRGKATLTPKERKDLNMSYEMIGNSLEEGGLEVRNYSWREVIEGWNKKGGKAKK